MNSRRTQILAQAALAAAAIYTACLITLPWCSLLGLAILSVAAIAAQVAPARFIGLGKLAWSATTLVVAIFLANLHRIALADLHAFVAGQIAVVVFFTACQTGVGKTKSIWNALGMFWAFSGVLILLIVSYLADQPGQFYFALATGLFLLVLCRICFRLRAFGIQFVNTLILFFAVFPAADLAIQFKARHDMNWSQEKYYSYEAAKKNPGGYVLWTRYYIEQWNKMMHECMEVDPNQFAPFRFRPDTQGHIFHSLVVINHKGFRGPEIPDEKGNTYRIVALGESTTWGCTLNQDDRPWPEILEQLIRERLHPARPVEVINAGVPGMALPGNVRRLTAEILALKPDMIISYHGFNGFSMLDHDMPPYMAKPPPYYLERPLRLIGDLEYGIKMTRYKKKLLSAPVHDHPSSIPPMQSDYAKAYRELIQITQTNGIRLVLANYSMAVNTNSEPALIDFYEQTVPRTFNAMRANLAHTEIVQELAKENPEICFVDTHPNFDGQHQYFVDLIHFTQAGRQHLAETFFAGIKTTLATDLAKNNGGILTNIRN
ncbi:MAG TPA: SGNH/GDSL hydrolase family protein [Verrucomicrobiae bacterium]|nr:SGNH/GDSL hydrolase family protein [Verrucomicrobiae bacterium]